MASAYQLQVSRLCGQKETLRGAKELLNVARSKTGPGSGHDLGSNATALPAICAFLASERLGNNDVVKKVAQDVSCLKPKDFAAALSTVRGALSGYLSQKQEKDLSYQALCRSHGLEDDALYWMEEVDKKLRKGEELEDLEVDEESVLLTVFYWTCIALNIRSVKQSSIISEYKVPLHAFQDLEDVLESDCRDLKESMGKFVSDSRNARSGLSSVPVTPGRSTPKRSGHMSSSKGGAGASLDPFSSPTKAALSRRIPDGSSPSKRRAVLPPLPFMSPVKKQKTTSPLKLNRLPVTSTLSTPSKSPAKASAFKTSPVKTYAKVRSVVDSLAQPTLPEPEEDFVSALPRSEMQADAGLPIKAPSTPVRTRIGGRSTMEPRTPSPRKSARLQSSIAKPSAPLHRSIRCRRTTSDVELEDIQMLDAVDATSDSSEDEEAKPPPCRHYLPVFADRLFYHYRDPRVLREWKACEKNMKDLVQKLGDQSGLLPVF